MVEIKNWFFVLIILYVVQTSILPYVAYNRQSPDLLLLFVMSFAILKGSKRSVLVGLTAGLLKGLAGGSFFGVDAFSYTLIAFIVGRFHRDVYKESIVMPFVAGVTTTLMYYAIVMAFMIMFGFKFSILEHVQNILLPMIVYEFIFSYPIYRLTVKLNAPKRAEWRRYGI